MNNYGVFHWLTVTSSCGIRGCRRIYHYLKADFTYKRIHKSIFFFLFAATVTQPATVNFSCRKKKKKSPAGFNLIIHLATGLNKWDKRSCGSILQAIHVKVWTYHMERLSSLLKQGGDTLVCCWQTSTFFLIEHYDCNESLCCTPSRQYDSK